MKPIYASPDRVKVRAHRQRGYVLFGMEVDRDVDALDIAIHFWPLTVDVTAPPRRPTR